MRFSVRTRASSSCGPSSTHRFVGRARKNTRPSAARAVGWNFYRHGDRASERRTVYGVLSPSSDFHARGPNSHGDSQSKPAGEFPSGCACTDDLIPFATPFTSRQRDERRPTTSRKKPFMLCLLINPILRNPAREKLAMWKGTGSLGGLAAPLRRALPGQCRNPSQVRLYGSIR